MGYAGYAGPDSGFPGAGGDGKSMTSTFRTKRAQGSALGLAAVLFLFFCFGVLGACSSDVPRRGSTRDALSAATVLASKDARLRALLSPRAAGEGWERSNAGFTSPGWRAAKDKTWDELGARV